MKKAVLFVLMMGLAVAAWAADEEANKKILKDAIVGAVTGAVAVEATKEGAPIVSEALPVTAVEDSGVKRHQYRDKKHHPKKNFHEKKKKDKKRPHGWDMGKKTGWGDKDVPPGLAGKDR